MSIEGQDYTITQQEVRTSVKLLWTVRRLQHTTPICMHTAHTVSTKVAYYLYSYSHLYKDHGFEVDVNYQLRSLKHYNI